MDNSPKIRWSHPTWHLFHSFSVCMKEDFYKKNKEGCLGIIVLICNNLPCPYCQHDASNYVRDIFQKKIDTKKDFEKYLFDFHNFVNKKTQKKIQKISIINKYKNINMDKCWRLFDRQFYRAYISGRNFQQWRRNGIRDKLNSFFKENWEEMFNEDQKKPKELIN